MVRCGSSWAVAGEDLPAAAFLDGLDVPGYRVDVTSYLFLCNPLAVLAGQFGVAGLGPPCNPLAVRPGVASLVLRGALQFATRRAEAYGLDAGHAVEQPAGLGRVNELAQGVPVLGGDLAALLLAFLRCVPVSGVGVVIRRHVGGVEFLEGGLAQRVGVGDL